jgi:ubiquitin-protein ligase
MQLPEAIWRRRLQSEVNELQAAGIRFHASADLTEITVEVNAPAKAKQNNTIISVNQHEVLLQINREYPYPGGLVAFWKTPLFHPNVHPKNGVVCIQLVNDWSEEQNLVSVVSGLKQLLENPNPQSPLNEEAANYYLSHPELNQYKPAGPRVVRL